MAAGATAFDPGIVLAELVRPAAAGPSANHPALSVGAQLLATVIGRDVLGRTLVKTDVGQIALARRVDAPRGSVLTLEIHETGGRLVVAVRSVSLPRATEPAQAEPTTAAATASAPRPVALPEQPVAPPRALFAVVDDVLAPAVRFAGLARNGPAATAGTVLGRDPDGRTLVRIGQGTLVVAPAVPAEAGTRVVVAAAGDEPRAVLIAPVAADTGAGAPDPPDRDAAPPHGPLGTVPVRATVEALIAPRGAADDTAFLPWLAPGARLVAFVGPEDRHGRPTITGPWGTLRLAGAATLAPGTLVAVEVLDVGTGLFIHVEPLDDHAAVTSPAPARGPSGPGGQTPAPRTQAEGIVRPLDEGDVIDIRPWADVVPPDLAPPETVEPLDGWPTLAGLVAALTRVAPEAARQVVEHRLPTPRRELAAALARFAAVAAATPAAAAWLGDGIAGRLVQAGHEPDVRALDAELERLVAPTAEPAGRVFLLPLLAPWGLLFAGLFVGGDAPGQDDEAQAAHRFVVELDLPRSGQLQLDGLVQDTRLDLVVRTPGSMPAALADDLATAFHEGCRAGGLDGAIRFAVAPEWPIQVRALAHPARGRSLTV